MQETPHILVIDDSSADLEIISIVCDALGCSVDVASDGFEAIKLYEERRHSLVVTDYRMEPMNGIYLISKIKEIDPNASFLMITGFPDNTARAFVTDNDLPEIVTKPISMSKMVDTLKLALTQGSGYSGRRHIAALTARMDDCPALIGESQLIQDVRASLLQFVAEKMPLLLLYGEEGVGRAEVARLLHLYGSNSRRNMVEHNFGTIAADNPLDGIITEDFESGPLLEKAQHGTLILEGIETLSSAEQSRLYSCFEEITKNVRLILINEQKLQPALSELPFQTIQLPALRERSEDVPAIIRFVAKSPIQFGLARALSDEEIARITKDLFYHDFTGNIIELIQRVRRLSDFDHQAW